MSSREQFVAMTDADRAALRKSHFIGWTVFTRMLIAIAILFGGAWCWLAWEAMHDNELSQSFGICTLLLFVLILFAVFTARHTRKTIDIPIAKDLADGRKVCAVGQVVEIKHVGEYNTVLVFGGKDGQVKEFNLTMRMMKEAHDALIVGKEVAVEYAPHILFLFSVRLTTPLSAEETAKRRQDETNTTISVLAVVGLLTLGLGWLLDIFIPMLIVAAATIAIVIGVMVYLRQK